MCTTVEVANTIAGPPVTGAATGWVRPVLAPISVYDNAVFNQPIVADEILGMGVESGNLNCNSWYTVSNTLTGLRVNDRGQIERYVRNIAIGIACCAPAQ